MDFEKIIRDADPELRQNATQEAKQDSATSFVRGKSYVRSKQAGELVDAMSAIHNALTIETGRAMGEQMDTIQRVVGTSPEAKAYIMRLTAVAFVLPAVSSMRDCESFAHILEILNKTAAALHSAMHYGQDNPDDVLARLFCLMADSAVEAFGDKPNHT